MVTLQVRHIGKPNYDASIHIVCTSGSGVDDSIVAIAVSAIVSFIVAFLLGTATGAVVLHCAVSRRSGCICRPCSKSPEDQTTPPGPTYETVSPPTQRENLELKKNLAYGPVRH